MDSTYSTNSGWITEGTGFSEWDNAQNQCSQGTGVIIDNCWRVCGDANMYRYQSTSGYQDLELSIMLEPSGLYETGENCQVQYNINYTEWKTFFVVWRDGKFLYGSVILPNETWNIDNLGIRIFPSTTGTSDCCYASRVELRGNFWSATPDPTNNPTITPTISPSQNPSDNPTKNPTKNPTQNPSMSPSATMSPSGNPTPMAPSMSPSNNPTNKSPSKRPTIDSVVQVTDKSSTSTTSTTDKSQEVRISETDDTIEIIDCEGRELVTLGGMLESGAWGMFIAIFIIGFCCNCVTVLIGYICWFVFKKDNDDDDVIMNTDDGPLETH